MTVRAPAPLAAVIGLAAVTADELRRLPARLPSLLEHASTAALDRYGELARHGQEVLSGRPADTAVPGPELVEVPLTPVPEPAPPIGLTEPVQLPEDVLEEIAQRPPGAELDRADLPLEDFDHLTVPQLRGRLRTLTLPGLVQLRDYETAHANRLPVLTLLDNRIAKLAEVP
ncbi:MAG TPA: hypothetical protein VF109_00800 [Mycobacteriales bacterium]